MTTHDEQHRHRCEIRDLCAKADARGIDWLKGYVHGWKRWPSLQRDFWTQFRAGNRGQLGDWREPSPEE